MSTEARNGDERYAVQDTISGAVYPQPNKLIAEKVAELHGQCIVVSFTPPADDVREALLECSTCGEIEGVKGECPNSKRPCGHHCNHVWTHDECDWCGSQFGEGGEVRPRGPITEAELDAAYAVLRGIAPREWVRKALEAARKAEAES